MGPVVESCGFGDSHYHFDLLPGPLISHCLGPNMELLGLSAHPGRVLQVLLRTCEADFEEAPTFAEGAEPESGSVTES